MFKGLLSTLIALFTLASYSQTSQVTISTDIFYGTLDETIHLRVSDTITNQVLYDSIATVTVTDGFSDTIYLTQGIYKCEVIYTDANVSSPTVIIDNVDTVRWGYPAYEYFLLEIGNKSSALRENRETINFSLFPNPTLDLVHLNFGKVYDKMLVQLFDLLGKKVIDKTVSYKRKAEVITTNLASGIYMVQLTSGNASSTLKLIVE